MLANLATALFEHCKITTTEARARRLRPVAERLINFAKRGDLHARRQVLTMVTDRNARSWLPGSARRRDGTAARSADRLDAAFPALGLQFGVQDGGVGDAVVPPLVDVRLERVEDASPVGGLDQQFLNAGGPANLSAVLRSSPSRRPISRTGRPSASRACTAACRSRWRATRRRSRPHTSRNPSGSGGVAGPAATGETGPAGCALTCPAGGSGSGAGSAAWCAMTVFSTASARFCQRWNRSATWTASGAPVRAPSA